MAIFAQFMNGLDLTSMQFAALAALACGVTGTAAAEWTKTYVVEWNEPAMYYGAKAGVTEQIHSSWYEYSGGNDAALHPWDGGIGDGLLLGLSVAIAAAVAAIYRAKGRPDFNPLIVHVADATGWAVQEALLRAAQAHPNITLLPHRACIDLITGKHEARYSGSGSIEDHAAFRGYAEGGVPPARLVSRWTAAVRLWTASSNDEVTTPMARPICW